MPSTTLCTNCNCPLSTDCPCHPGIENAARQLCHICSEVNKISLTSSYFQNLDRED